MNFILLFLSLLNSGIPGDLALARDTEAFDCREYLLSKATWAIKDIRLLARDQKRGRLPLNQNDQWYSFHYYLNQAKCQLISSSESKIIYDWIDASSIWIAKPAVRPYHWANGYQGSIPVETETCESSTVINGLLDVSKNVFTKDTMTRVNDYAAWVNSLAADGSADFETFDRVNRIFEEMNHHVCETCFCKPPKKPLKKVGDFYLFQQYDYLTLEEAKEIVRTRLF